MVWESNCSNFCLSLKFMSKLKYLLVTSKCTRNSHNFLYYVFIPTILIFWIYKTFCRVRKSRNVAHLSKSCDDIFSKLVQGGISPDELYDTVCKQVFLFFFLLFQILFFSLKSKYIYEAYLSCSLISNKHVLLVCFIFLLSSEMEHNVVEIFNCWHIIYSFNFL